MARELGEVNLVSDEVTALMEEGVPEREVMVVSEVQRVTRSDAIYRPMPITEYQAAGRSSLQEAVVRVGQEVLVLVGSGPNRYEMVG
jgi:hypothetical protein